VKKGGVKQSREKKKENAAAKQKNRTCFAVPEQRQDIKPE
jgi:hypothetical protein